MARLVSLGIIAALIVCLGITFYRVLAPFLMPLFLAAMTALMCQPVFRYALKRCNGRRALASALTAATIIGSVTLPVLLGIIFGVLQFIEHEPERVEQFEKMLLAGKRDVDDEVEELRDQISTARDRAYGWVFPVDGYTTIDREIFGKKTEEFLRDSPTTLRAVREQWLYEKMVKARGQFIEVMKTLSLKTVGVVGSSIGAALNRTVDLLSALVGSLVALIVFSLALYYFLLDGPELIVSAQALIPIEREHQARLMTRFAESVRAVVMATFLAAIGQGIATALALQVVGFGYFFVIATISTLAAMIPMAGTWLVWMPCALWLGYVQDDWWSAAFLTGFGLIVVGMMDNVIRTWVLQSDTKLHPLLAFVSVLGGLQVMGLWGVFVGPIVACCLHSLIEIFNEELHQVEEESTKPGDEKKAKPDDDSPEARDSEAEELRETPSIDAAEIENAGESHSTEEAADNDSPKPPSSDAS